VRARFAALLAAARAEVGPPPDAASPPRGLLYRRAVPTDARRGVPPPEVLVAGLRLASNGVAVLVAEEFPGGRLDAALVDAALHAARVAGATWAAAWVRAAGDVAVLRDLGFLPMAEEESPR
jgi:hypothetical protein